MSFCISIAIICKLMLMTIIARVSYCTVDPYYDKVFCYIARNGETKKLECHAYLCGKRSKVSIILY